MASPVVYTLGRCIVDLYGEETGVEFEQVHRFAKYVGGSAANTAVGLARLGLATGLISRVGEDRFGRYLLAALAEEGVDARMVGRDPVLPTGLAFAALKPPEDSDVVFYGNPNANQGVSIQDLDWSAIASAKYLVVGGTALAASPAREAVLMAMAHHRRTGGMNLLDVDWRPMFWSDPGTADFYYHLALQYTDVVLANAPELALVGGSADARQSAMALKAEGVREVVAKQGAQGVRHFGPDGECQIPALQVSVVNTLGAGDGFAAGLVAALEEPWTVPERLRFAAATAALVVSRHSCSEAMPRRAEVEALLAQGSMNEEDRR
ncbi:MAG: 5-dehydro-2-deoxygluconokinase [Firmicutes bacterium]|jgi:5-dehydro-2-deoxygluconokinase|nr:5-dehydro-2-deoxygluconokinase [Bacillota bacterium]